MKNIKDYNLEDLKKELLEIGEKPFRAEQIFKWLYQEKVKALRSGYIAKLDALTIGIASMKLGGGREKKDDIIDMAAGIVLNYKVGDHVNKGDVLCTLYTERPHYDIIAKEVLSAYDIVDEQVVPMPLIYETIE